MSITMASGDGAQETQPVDNDFAMMRLMFLAAHEQLLWRDEEMRRLTALKEHHEALIAALERHIKERDAMLDGATQTIRDKERQIADLHAENAALARTIADGDRQSRATTSHQPHIAAMGQGRTAGLVHRLRAFPVRRRA